jgi:DNA processing protein
MELLFELALFLVPRIGNVNYKILIKQCGDAEQVFKTPKGKLMRIQGIGEQTASSIQQKNTFTKAEEIIKRAKKEDCRILYFLNDDFPNRLRKHPDSPVLLFYKGSADLNPKRSISIVGTRKITDNGIKTVRHILKDIAPYDVQIISGLAYGVDFHSHQQALENKLETIGVMASGMDLLYPSSHKNLAHKMLSQGGLLTEQLFGTEPIAPNFPARNRIIAGMSDAIIVVEAARKGGALITARIANSYNIEVLACPGRITDLFNTGCNLLIENHEAHIYNSISSLARLLNWDDENIKENLRKKIELSSFTETEQQLLSALQKHAALTKDEIVKMTGLAFHQIPAILLKLEMEDIIQVKTGGLFALKD